ncbi:FAD-dependent glycerol-3-phosphate dehydrogenase [Candidatus Magnetomorum sp. HK-1]|nr:FAD-dependent glycerol-3-phosphate dehydrogenase [Candidatus Magnetomorum sp. HK-1]
MQLKENWDLVIIGGGITGSGILREASRMNLRVLLVEQKDFAWGTSSRSSKLVHGGLRYLKECSFLLTRHSVIERERLITEAKGLVDPLDFLMPIYSDHGVNRWLVKIGLTIYDFLALKQQHSYFSRTEFLNMAPFVRKKNLLGGFKFVDAQVDDARLVLRVLSEAIQAGGTAKNYTTAKEIVRDSNGNVTGIVIQDTETLETQTLKTNAIINASGAWAEQLHPSPQPGLHLRPLRGSHLIFPSHCIPVKEAVSFEHPEDRRPVFAIPWEGAVLFGTTDVDYNGDLNQEPVITKDEATYLMTAIHERFPNLNIKESDCLSSIAGVRPVLSEQQKDSSLKKDPSKETREHVVWINKGLVTITGGKLTTFRLLAWDALKAVKPFLNSYSSDGKGQAVFTPIDPSIIKPDSIKSKDWQRLCGRYGNSVKDIILQATENTLTKIPNTKTFWAELPYVAANENIRHLSDLMLRRVRIGLLLKDGGKEYLDKIQTLCSPVLDWNKERWAEEKEKYISLWQQAHGVPFT